MFLMLLAGFVPLVMVLACAGAAYRAGFRPCWPVSVMHWVPEEGRYVSGAERRKTAAAREREIRERDERIRDHFHAERVDRNAAEITRLHAYIFGEATDGKPSRKMQAEAPS